MIVGEMAFVASRRLSDSNDIGIQEIRTPSALLWTMDNQTSFKVSNQEKATVYESRLSRQSRDRGGYHILSILLKVTNTLRLLSLESAPPFRRRSTIQLPARDHLLPT